MENRVPANFGSIIESIYNQETAEMLESYIHLNPAHKGKFHEWLGKSEDEPITAADIAKGLASGNPHVREMANFARNERHFKH